MPAVFGRAVFGPVIGFISVLMGIGGGSFGVPLMTLHNVPIHRAVATAAGFGVIIAAPLCAGVSGISPTFGGRTAVHAGLCLMWWRFLLVISMTLMTAPMGARLAHRLNPKPLRRIFAGFLIIVATGMLLGG